jgi:tRNA-dihydrouridine synthase C
MLAPMDGITDAPMRALMGESGAFSYGVTEFVRVSGEALPAKVFRREVPELLTAAKTVTGMPVQVQILGGDPDLLAQTALTAAKAGAPAIDINFGCPAPTVNRHDGGATLLQFPDRIEAIVAAVRAAVPREVPVSAKLRLGWDEDSAIHENAERAQSGGANWITIHARTRMQGYHPPVNWVRIAEVQRYASVPVIANGDIWTLDDFHRCREITGCTRFMLGRAALARPELPRLIAAELGGVSFAPDPLWDQPRWGELLRSLVFWTAEFHERKSQRPLMRIKQWLNLAHRFGEFRFFGELKHAETLEEFFSGLDKVL